MDKTTRPANLIAAAGLGALLMYLFDPQQGRRRTALARDRLNHLTRKGRDMTDAGMRDLSNRARGLAAEARTTLRRALPSDEVLVERVRAELGRWTSHPHAIGVTAHEGHVTLAGDVLLAEQRQVLRGVRSVRGVLDVENLMQAHVSPEGVPGLQGRAHRLPRPHMEFLQQHWAPGPRLLALAGGAAMAAWGLGRGRLPGALTGALGVGLVVRAATNRSFGTLVGAPAGRRRGIEIQKTVHLDASPEAVFDLWAKPENFPRFMSLVEEVQAIDDRRSHWIVKGPAGTRLEWDSVVTEHSRPRLLAWRSEPGSPVEHAGTVRFAPEEGGGTRVHVHLSYHPPGGAVGHAVASLLGRDPKRDMDEDLMRMKSAIETGVPPHDAAQRGSMVPPTGGPATGGPATGVAPPAAM